MNRNPDLIGPVRIAFAKVWSTLLATVRCAAVALRLSRTVWTGAPVDEELAYAGLRRATGHWDERNDII